MKFAAENELDAPIEISLTSLIDVLFTLLFFFMVTTSFVTAQSIKVNLPVGQSAGADSSDEPVVVTVQSNGMLSVGKDSMDKAALTDFLKARVESGKASTIILRADREASHGSVVEIMELAHGAGVQKLAVATEKQLK